MKPSLRLPTLRTLTSSLLPLFCLLLLMPLCLIAQDTVTTIAPSGALQTPEAEGLPWTYIVLVVLLLAVFIFLRRKRTLPSKRR